MELYPQITYYLGGTTDLSVKYARIDGKRIGREAQKIIIPNQQELLSENPVRIFVDSEECVTISSVFDDSSLVASGDCGFVSQEGCKVSSNTMLSAQGQDIAEVQFQEVDEKVSDGAGGYSGDGIWREEDELLFVRQVSGIDNVSTFFHAFYDVAQRFLPDGVKMSVLHIDPVAANLDLDSLESMSEFERLVHAYAGDEVYLTAQIHEAFVSLPSVRETSDVVVFDRSNGEFPYVCTPLYLADAIFAYVILDLRDDAFISSDTLEIFSRLARVVESELFSVVAKDPQTRTRIGKYERGVAFLDEVNSTCIGRLAKSKAWQQAFGDRNALVSQRELFINRPRSMRFYRRIGDLYFYLTYASANQSSKAWVSYEIAHSSILFIQESFRHMTFALRSELDAPNSSFALPLQYRASIARSDGEEDNGRMRMEYVGSNIDQDFIGEPLNVLSTLERFTQPFCITMHRWIARDLATQMLGVLGGHAPTGKLSYTIEHRISLISLLGLQRRGEVGVYDSVLRCWLSDVEAYGSTDMPGMVETIYHGGATDFMGRTVSRGEVRFAVILPVKLSDKVRDITFREPLLRFEETYEADLLGCENVIDLIDDGNGLERKIVGYRHLFSLSASAHGRANGESAPTDVANVYLSIMLGQLCGYREEFKYFFKSLRLREMEIPTSYLELSEDVFSKGMTSKKEWDLLWEPLLRKRYEPILTNEFGVYF